MKSLCAILGVLATAIVLAACGGGGTTTVIEKTVSTTPASSGSASTPQAALKAYDLAWADGDAGAACELLVDSGRRAVETEMSNRTLGGLPLNCPERMEEVLQLLGPEAVAQLEELASKVSSEKLSEHGDIAEITVNPAVFMELKKVGEAWYIDGSTIKEIEPLVTREEIEEVQAEEQSELDEAVKEGEEENPTEEGINRAEKTGPGSEIKEAERMASESVETVSGEAVEFVTCPGPITPEKGDRFTCDLSTTSGVHYQSEMEVFDPAGDLVVIRSFVSHEH